MMNLSVSGFDRLQRELEDAQRALASLDGTISTLRFDPTNAASVQRAIQQMETAIDAKVASYANNAIVAPLVQAAKEQYRAQILTRTREHHDRQSNETASQPALQVMDYLGWCVRILSAVDAAEKSGLAQEYVGVHTETIASALFESLPEGPSWHTSPQRHGLLGMLKELQEFGLIKSIGHGIAYSLTPAGRAYLANPAKSWESTCAWQLEPAQEQVLNATMDLCVQLGSDHVLVSAVGHDAVLSKLGWENGTARLLTVAEELNNLGLIRIPTLVGGPYFSMVATMTGIVWAIKRGYVFESRRIDDLVEQWETTSVDFKRELHTGTKGEKAELVKDLLALANTQASGPRLLVIGFAPRTHAYHGPPDPRLSQDHFEQVVAMYTEPVVDLRYRVVDYRVGPVGEIEVLRDRRKLPYRVKSDLGDEQHRIHSGDVFVRHGSQVEKPTEAELAAIEAEGTAARGPHT